MELRDCLEREDRIAAFIEADGSISFEDLDGLLEGAFSIEGKVAIPCSRAAWYGIRDGSPILDIPIELDGLQIGFLCLCSKLRDARVEFAAITEFQRHALVRLASPIDFDQGGEGLLRQELDCVVIDRSQLEHFLDKRSTSALWGGFILRADEISIERTFIEAETAKIDVLNLESPRTTRHQAALQRATEMSIASDRFLHLYHFLELDYDHEIIERISRIDRENTRGLEKLLVTGRAELERLLLICEGFTELQKLEQIALKLRNHRDAALAVFYTYGKDHNPLKDQVQFERQFLEAAAITRPELDSIKRAQGLESNFAKDNQSYSEMLVRLACYWVYRIRCCIAHNKLGEYHLRSAADMRFIAEFGEPLIKALIVHRLTPRQAP